MKENSVKHLSELLEKIAYRWLHGSKPDPEVTGIAQDNRRIEPGQLFVCIRGAKFDTHTKLPEIAAAGACGAVVEQDVETEGLPEDFAVIRVEETRLALAELAAAWYGHPAEKFKAIIGVTGSKGKTTVTHMIQAVLDAAGHETGTIGSNGAIIRGQVHELNNTTPDAMEVQMYLEQMAEAGVEYAVVESSSQGLMQHRVSGFTFDYGIFTNISEGDHISPAEHKDFADYLQCKSLLLKQSRQAIIFSQDRHTPAMLEEIAEKNPAEVFFFGRGEANGLSPELAGKYSDRNRYYVTGEEKTYEDEMPGQRFVVTGGPYQDLVINCNMCGDFNVTNALAAIAVAGELGIPAQAVTDAMAHLKIKGRLEMVYNTEQLKVCVDFAHNGYSTRNLLEALREYRPRRLVCIFGADGNRAISRRTEMGEASGRLADLSIVTSGHNRWETFENICKDIMVGMEPTGGKYLVIPNRKEAIRYAIENRQDGDLITIIGLGHETYQEEMGVKYPYSDSEYVLGLIQELVDESL